MHHHNEISVFTSDQTDRSESPAGVGWLVTPSVVVMRLPGHGAMPGQPSHVHVPAVSGGGRDESIEEIAVLGAYESEVLGGWIALQLDHDCSIPPLGDVPEGIDLSALSMDDLARGSGGATLDGWVCRCFPRLPGCR